MYVCLKLRDQDAMVRVGEVGIFKALHVCVIEAERERGCCGEYLSTVHWWGLSRQVRRLSSQFLFKIKFRDDKTSALKWRCTPGFRNHIYHDPVSTLSRYYSRHLHTHTHTHTHKVTSHKQEHNIYNSIENLFLVSFSIQVSSTKQNRIY